MRIITVNLPLSYLKAIDSLTGETGLYPSRSELIRVAVRDFLIKELEAAKSFSKYQTQIQQFNDPGNQPVPAEHVKMKESPDLYVQVPMGASLAGTQEYKTFRIVKK